MASLKRKESTISGEAPVSKSKKAKKDVADTAASTRSRRNTSVSTVKEAGSKDSKTTKDKNSRQPTGSSVDISSSVENASTKSNTQVRSKGRQNATSTGKTSSSDAKNGRVLPSEAKGQMPVDAADRKSTKKDVSRKTDTKATNSTTMKGHRSKNEVDRGGVEPSSVTKHVEREDDGHSYWLMKAEPESRIEKGVDVKFSIQDLEAADEPEPWDGVRNPAARNNMKAMIKGDLAFFYHSNCKVPAVVGIMEIVKEHSPDKAALDPKHPYYDPKEKEDSPKWCVVHVEHRLTFDTPVRLKDLQQYKGDRQPLTNMQMLKQSRLSVSKVSRQEWNFILGQAKIDDKKWQAEVQG